MAMLLAFGIRMLVIWHLTIGIWYLAFGRFGRFGRLTVFCEQNILRTFLMNKYFLGTFLETILGTNICEYFGNVLGTNVLGRFW